MTDVADKFESTEHAEAVVMGAWLFGEFREHLKLFHESDFTRRRPLFREIKAGKSQADSLEISQATKLSGEHTSAAEISTLATQYTNMINRAGEFRQFAKKIIQDNLINDIINQVDNQQKLMQSALERLKIIDGSQNVRPEETEHWLSGYLTELDRRAEQQPLKYDIKGLNQKLGGLKRGELTTIAARPGVGKSTLALQTAEHIARDGHKVLYFNLEMTMDQVVDRLILRHTNVPYWDLHAGKISKQHAGEIAVALDGLAKLEANISFKRINRNVDYFPEIIEAEKPELIIIDQLSHVTANFTAGSIREKYIYTVEALKRLAIENNLPVLLLAQVNREAEKYSKPVMANLKESGVIEETSDNVLLLYTDTDEETPGQLTLPCTLEIAKNRQGPLGKVNLTFRKNKCHFVETVYTATEQHKFY